MADDFFSNGEAQVLKERGKQDLFLNFVHFFLFFIILRAFFVVGKLTGCELFLIHTRSCLENERQVEMGVRHYLESEVLLGQEQAYPYKKLDVSSILILAMVHPHESGQVGVRIRNYANF